MKNIHSWSCERNKVIDPGQLKYPKKFVFSFEKCDQAVVDERNLYVQSSRLEPEVNDHKVS